MERLSGLQGAQDRRETSEVMMRAFRTGPNMEDLLYRSRWTGVYGAPEYTRVVVAEGRVVSAVVTAPRAIRFGPVAVPAITIGPVGTHDRHCRKGYAATAMRETNRWAREQGVLVAYLQGIADFYHRFGYYPFAAYGTLKFQRREAEKVAAKGRVRKMTRGDLRAVSTLYRRISAARFCSAEREPALWPWLLKTGGNDNLFAEPRVILNEQGAVVGYFTRARRDGLHAPEIVVKPDEAGARVALGALTRLAKQREWKEISLSLPYDDPFCAFARQHVNADYGFNSHPTGGLLMAILDFPELLRRIEPMFAERRKAAGAMLKPQAFTLASDIGEVGLTITRSGVTIGEAVKGPRVTVPQRWLSGLLTGHWTPDDIAARPGVRLPKKLLPLLRALFPRTFPHVYQGDNY